MRASARPLAAAFSALILGVACASHPGPAPRTFPPADEALAVRALGAWSEAIQRADSLPPSRLLYDARFGKGSVRAPGNLAVVARPDSVTAKATGPLGGELGEYEDGTFHGKNGESYLLDPELLRGVLAGVWRGGLPAVAGAAGEEVLLRWRESGGVVVEGVFELAGARLRSLVVRGPRGEVSVEFSGAFDPWPEGVRLSDARSGRSLKLRLVVVEGLKEGS